MCVCRKFLFNVIPRLKFHNPDVVFQTKKGPKSVIQVQLSKILLSLCRAFLTLLGADLYFY